MRIIRRILLVILLTIPAVKYAQTRADIDDPPEEYDVQLDRGDMIERQEAGPETSTQGQINRAGTGRVYVYYGTGQQSRSYHNRRYYQHRKGYPYTPYSYRYYYYPYQRPSRFYKRGW